MACARFTILSDSIALEMGEEFEVSFVLQGATDAEGRLLINNGRDRAVPGLQAARVRIMDRNGKKIGDWSMELACASFVHVNL